MKLIIWSVLTLCFLVLGITLLIAFGYSAYNGKPETTMLLAFFAYVALDRAYSGYKYAKRYS